MTVYSGPYKVGLIYAGTKLHKADSLSLEQHNHWQIEFPRQRCVCKKAKVCSLRFVNIAPHQSAQVIIQSDARYVEFFSFLGDLIFGSVHSAFSGFRFHFRSDSEFGLKKCEGLVSTMFRQQAAKYPCEPVWGTLVCFIRGVKGFMDTCHTPRSCWVIKFLGAHPIYVEYLISVNCELNIIKTLKLMCRLCDFFSSFKAKFIIKQLIIGTNDDLICRDYKILDVVMAIKNKMTKRH